MVEHTFIGFSPDIDYTTPGAIIGGSNFVPTWEGGDGGSNQRLGISGAPSPQSAGYPALAAACRGAASVRMLDNSTRLFAGSQTKLYEGSGGSWTDQTRASGGDYTGSSESRWRFAQVGNTTFATNGVDELQESTSSGKFADTAGSPPAMRYLAYANGHLMGFHYDDGTEYPDGWYTSAQNDTTDWSNAIATGSVSGRLTATPGRITGAHVLGDEVMVYKERSIYRGIPVGPPFWWEFQPIAADVGALNHEAVVNLGSAHVFAGFDDFYLLDGTRPVAIGEALRGWWQGNLNNNYRYRVEALHDRRRANIYFFFPSSGSESLDMALVYNYRRSMWGKAEHAAQAVLSYISQGMTYDQLGSFYTTYDDLPQIPYDSPFWTASTESPAFFDSDSTLGTLTGPCDSASILTGWTGDHIRHSQLSNVYPKLRGYDEATTPTCTHHYSYVLGSEADDGTGETASMARGKFDFRRVSRWHRLAFDFTGDFTIAGYRMELQGAGRR